MSNLRSLFSRLRTRAKSDDRGASLVEYALLVALIAVVCIGAVTYIGQSASTKYSSYDNCVSWAGTGGTVPSVCH
jgi:pilus assembly protein Flp/PilA